jgi:hypothetical protein
MRSCAEREEISGGRWPGATASGAIPTAGGTNSNVTTLIAGAPSSEGDCATALGLSSK